MKYSTVLLSFVVGAFAIPQDASITSAPAAAASGNLTPSQSCAIACTPGDVTCQAACLGIARPNESQVIGTNECAAKCDQGDGSPEATQKFSDCVQGCIGSLFPSSQTVPLGQQASNAASQVASNKAQPTGTDAAAGTGASTGSETGNPSATNSAAGGNPSGAANANAVHMFGAGLAGLLAIFAL